MKKSARRSDPKKQATSEALPTTSSAPARIVGIGASAGGLEALDAFLGNVPPEPGLAFVVVQHLDPTRAGMLPELLQRSTVMPVVQIEDRMKVEADHVYVIPPNRDLSILHGVLHLLEPAAPRGLRLPIDFFFRSLAEDQQERSIGVILSGMGSDGALGLRAIKERAGAMFVQSPDSAKFDGMPRSAMDAANADVVATADELPGRILDFLRHVPRLGRRGRPRRRRTGAASKRSSSCFVVGRVTISRCTRRARSIVASSAGWGSISCRGSTSTCATSGPIPQECDLLFQELLIGVTSFFRDPPVWEQLKEEVIPDLAVRGGVVRAWVPACSTGEEAYSLAMIFREVVDRLAPPRGVSLQVFATDLDKGAIQKARVGTYPAQHLRGCLSRRLARFFVEEDGGYRVGKEVRELVIFAPQNLVMDPPFTKLDLLLCRNLLIYLEPELQRKVLPLFHYSLNPDGVLVLGTSESADGFRELFSALPGKNRIYRTREHGTGPTSIDFPPAFARMQPADRLSSSASPVARSTASSLQAIAETSIARHYAPAAVLVTEKGDIVYISGKTGKYLEPAVGKANLNLFAMAREGLARELADTFRRALMERAVTVADRVGVVHDGATQDVKLTVHPLSEPDAVKGMVLVVFQDLASAPIANARVRPRGGNERETELLEELERARKEAEDTRTAMQASEEELRSANEELQSTNEELQSTNEELTTSKEEMQSMNEELQTVNQELQAKVAEWSRASSDMSNLLNSTDIATLFLDEDLLVRRFTTPATEVFKLLPGDVGRPLSDLTTGLEYPELFEDARSVLRTLVHREKAVSTRDGRWYTVRIMPYRTLDNRIDGLVITLADITATKELEQELRATGERLRALLKGTQGGAEES